MPFVKRDAQGRITALNRTREAGFDEELNSGDPEVRDFLGSGEDLEGSFETSDRDFVRVLEDVIQLLIDKGIILFTDLPEVAQEKIVRRQTLRQDLGRKLDLLGDD